MNRVPLEDEDAEEEAMESGSAIAGTTHKCFCDTSRGQDEIPVPTNAVLHGDNPKSSQTARQDSKASMVDGPFGGSKSA